MTMLATGLNSCNIRSLFNAGYNANWNKIPLFNEDWEKFEKIAEYYREKKGINISSGQIASALIPNLEVEVNETWVTIC